MRNFIVGLLIAGLGILGLAAYTHYLQQQCYASCHTDTECERCDIHRYGD